MQFTPPSIPWEVAPADEAAAARLAAELGVSEITAHILVTRGLGDAADARRFLAPDLEAQWADPDDIAGMPEAAERVARAVTEGASILVFGDFDLDGVSAAAVATRGLLAMGGKARAVVPHRFREGYGLTAVGVERALSHRPDLIVTVDCGVSAAEEVAAILERGVDVVITDHHEPGDSVPQGVPVANPKLSADSASRDLAGAGVALKLVQAVGRRLGHPEAWRDLTDLATLGTVADIVSLHGENRALVATGLAAVRSGARPALAALCAIAGVDATALSADEIAFALAPRLNAAGRMADPKIALDLLLTDDAQVADGLARALDEHNRTRQSVEADLTAAAEKLAARAYAGERALVLAGEGWHDGVKGIVASRIARAYGRPAFLFTIEDGVARGSGRSVGRVDLFRAVEAASASIDRYGGHAGAVGLSLPADELERFRTDLLAALDELAPEEFAAPLGIDAVVGLHDLSIELGAEIERLEPFGAGNPRPTMSCNGVFMNGRERVGKTANHLKFMAFDGTTTVPAIAFQCKDIGALSERSAAVDVAFQLQVDEWRGRRRAQMIVRDFHLNEGIRGDAGQLVEDLFARADEILAREEYAGIEDAPSFHTKLAGVTFEGRQDLLKELVEGVPLRIERQPDNPHDANACALFDPAGSQVGFFNRRLAAVLARAIDAGVDYDVEVTEVTGGDEGRALGVNVLVTRRDAAVDAADSAEARALQREQLAQLTGEALDSAIVSRLIGDRPLHDAQREALAHLAQGTSTLAVMATGRGKSLIFHVHAARTALTEGRSSVFVYPLRALVADQAFHLEQSMSELGLCVRVVTGETSTTDRDLAFAALAGGGLDIVLTTPEFLHFHSARFAESGRVGFVVVDEAHHVGLARAGHRPAYARLGEALEKLGSPTVLAVTATASNEVADQIRQSLGVEEFVLDPTVRDNLNIEDRRNTAEKDAAVAALAAQGGKTIVYVNSRDASVRIARMLRKRVPELGWKTAFYNGGLSRSVRHAVERAFRSGEVQVVVATSAFGEGVNIPDIRNVVLYHLPFNEVEFNQMAGRCGRDGAAARVHLMFGEKDARINETILASLAPDRDDLATLYRVLRELAAVEGEGFEITNAELAERCVARSKACRLEDKGVSASLGVFRELGLVTGEGHGAYRRLTLVGGPGKVDLASSVRYAEGLDEIEEFGEFRQWALTASCDELLARFNRPILPTAKA